MVVDRLMHVFPTHPAGVALAGPVAADPVTVPIEFAYLPESMWRISPGAARS
jgi:hypothetical protein